MRRSHATARVPLGRADDSSLRVRCAVVVAVGPQARIRLADSIPGSLVFEEATDCAYAVFSSADLALAAAHRANDGTLSISVHVGTALHHATGYAGRSLTQAMRVARATEEGTVVLTASAASAVRHARVIDMGMRQVAGLPRPLRLYAS